MVVTDRLAEIERQLPSAGYWYPNAKWLVEEIKRLQAELKSTCENNECEMRYHYRCSHD